MTPVLDKRLDRWHSELAQLFDLTETCFSRLKKRRDGLFSMEKREMTCLLNQEREQQPLCFQGTTWSSTVQRRKRTKGEKKCTGAENFCRAVSKEREVNDFSSAVCASLLSPALFFFFSWRIHEDDSEIYSRWRFIPGERAPCGFL